MFPLVKDPGDPVSWKLNKTRRGVQKTKRQQVFEDSVGCSAVDLSFPGTSNSLSFC